MSNKLIKQKDTNVQDKDVEKQKLSKKTILIRIFETFAVILFVIAMAIGYGYYINNHHGYKTSDEVISKYINTMDNQYVALAKLCFDDKSQTYESSVNDIISNTQLQNMDIQHTIVYNEIDIQSTDIESIDELKTITGNDKIKSAKANTVKIPMQQTVNNEVITLLYYYNFITYCDDTNKWFVHSLNFITFEEELSADTTIVYIGSNETGYIPLPDNWIETDITETSEYVKKEITYSSKLNETISLIAMSNDVSVAGISKLSCDSLTSQNFTYEIDENSRIDNYKCTFITGLSETGEIADMIWIFATPLEDNYIHYIEVSCLTQNSELYIDYVSSFKLH